MLFNKTKLAEIACWMCAGIILAVLALTLYARNAKANMVLPMTPILLGTTVNMGGSLLLAGACNNITVTIPGAQIGMVAVATPQGTPPLTVTWSAYISGPDTVVVKVCALVAATPTAMNYSVRVIN